MSPTPPSARPCAVIRVSTDDQDYRQQRAEVVRWCAASLGVELPDADIFIEEGVSGWKNTTLDSRPGLKMAVEACLAGRYTHLVVHKVDRTARNVTLMSGVIDNLVRHGVTFISVLEGLDTSQLGAVFAIKLLATFAEHFGNNLSAEIQKGKRRRREAGLPNGIIPYGAVNGPDNIPIPDTRPILLGQKELTPHELVLHIFQEVASGVNPAALTCRLNMGQTPAPRGALWSRATVRRILDNPFYLGYVRGTDDDWVRGAHAPLVPQDLWDAAHRRLRLMAERPERAKYGSVPRIFGRGVLRCMACHWQGRHHAYYYITVHQEHYYVCAGRSQFKTCGEPYVTEDALEADFLQLLTWDVDAAALEQGLNLALAEALAGQPDQAALRRKRASIETRLKRLADLYELEDIPRADYLTRRDTLRQELRGLDYQLRQQQTVSLDDLRAAAEEIRALPEQWDRLNVAEKSVVVRQVFQTIWVQGGRIVALEPHEAYQAVFAVTQPDLVGAL